MRPCPPKKPSRWQADTRPLPGRGEGLRAGRGNGPVKLAKKKSPGSSRYVGKKP